jgi:hypothetical protein
MKKSNLVLLGICIICLSGCSGSTKSSLGFKKQAPNEYEVFKQPPLTIPPNFDLLPPEQKTDIQPTTTEEEFDQIFHGEARTDISSNNRVTESDKAFLNKTNNYNKRSDIKKILNNETKASTEPEPKKKGFFSKLFSKDK